jgi:hypothetical protein
VILGPDGRIGSFCGVYTPEKRPTREWVRTNPHMAAVEAQWTPEQVDYNQKVTFSLASFGGRLPVSSESKAMRDCMLDTKTCWSMAGVCLFYARQKRSDLE